MTPGKRILIVDDEPFRQNLCKEWTLSISMSA